MAEVPNTHDYRTALSGKEARRCGIALYVLSATWGAIQLAFPDSGILHFAFVLLFAAFATGWAVFDAKSRGIQFLHILQMLYFFVWPVGAVIYLFYRSGIRGLLTAAVHGIGLLLTQAVAFYVTLFTLHAAGMLDARYYG